MAPPITSARSAKRLEPAVADDGEGAARPSTELTGFQARAGCSRPDPSARAGEMPSSRSCESRSRRVAGVELPETRRRVRRGQLSAARRRVEGNPAELREPDLHPGVRVGGP